MPPRRWGSISTTVILHPKAARMLANSQPITPPPIITMLFGRVFRASSWVLSITRSPLSPGMGGAALEDPVAIRMFRVL